MAIEATTFQTPAPKSPRGQTLYEKNVSPRPLITDPSQRPVIPEVKPQPPIDDTKFDKLLLGVVETYKGFEHVDFGKPIPVEYQQGEVVETNGRHARWLLTDSPGCFVRLPRRDVWNPTIARAFLTLLVESVKLGESIPTYDEFQNSMESRRKELANAVKEKK